MLSLKTLTLTASVLIAGSFSASAILTPVNTIGGNGREQSLQDVLDANGFGGIDVQSDADQLDDSEDSFWTLSGSADGSASIIIEIAGYRGNNSFGIYNPITGDKSEIFAGAASAGDSTSFSTTWNVFGFYLENNVNGSFTWYSDSSNNADGENDHLVVYDAGSKGFIFAWEDLNLGDWDYQDMVVQVSGVTSVPDGGATLILLGAGLTALGAFRRRR